MILYVNGDSHSAGAEAVNPFAFANDDPHYKYLGRIPHPDNLFVSYGNILAKNLSAELYCDAESASSNDRIIRTTRHYLKNNQCYNERNGTIKNVKRKPIIMLRISNYARR